MKANILMDQMFDVDHAQVSTVVDVDDIDVIHRNEYSESLRDLILEFWYQQIFTVYMVCCDLAEAGTRSINC